VAITNAQREVALVAILNACVASPASDPIPGVTVAEVYAAILAALGTTVDVQFEAMLTQMLAPANAAVAAAQALVTSLTVM
jgi:hypothetical protein